MTKNSPIPGKTIPQAHRSQAAEVRQRDRGTRSAESQLALLDSRPGRSARERARLEAAK